MLRCIHMMSNNEPRVKVASMRLLSDGCLAITDENILLPIVHKMWSPLMARIQDRQPAIVEQVGILTLCIAHTSPIEFRPLNCSQP